MLHYKLYYQKYITMEYHKVCYMVITSVITQIATI